MRLADLVWIKDARRIRVPGARFAWGRTGRESGADPGECGEADERPPADTPLVEDVLKSVASNPFYMKPAWGERAGFSVGYLAWGWVDGGTAPGLYGFL
jgi:hypothetical protein